LTRTASNEYERNLLGNIQRHGWQCTSVSASPPFSYTIGLYRSFGHPELIIFGLEHEVAHGILGVAARAAAAGHPFDLQSPTDRLLEGYSSVFVEVPQTEYENYVLSALWYYEGKSFPLFQVVWPSASGDFPWHPAEAPSFAMEQPVLGVPSGGT
jgi:Domain of unknown function (DUF4262)